MTPTDLLLDTDVLIDIERRRPEAVAWITEVSPLPPVAGFAAWEPAFRSRARRSVRSV